MLTAEVEDPHGTLRALQRAVSRELAARRLYEPEARPYRPHATVARLRPDAQARRGELPGPEPLEFRGEALTLYRSQLRREGARYERARAGVPALAATRVARDERWCALGGDDRRAALMLLAAAAPAAARLRWSGCGDVEAECARVRVPLDRSGAVPGSVRLRMARYGEPSRADAALPVRRAGRRGRARVRRRAVRGRRPVEALRARLLRPARHRRLGPAALPGARARPAAALDRAPARRARARWARGARFYRTRDSVEDVEALRQALGVEKLTLFGISYGTKLALAYARAHPDRVERIALDSVLDPDDADAFGLEPYRRWRRRWPRCARRAAGA